MNRPDREGQTFMEAEEQRCDTYHLEPSTLQQLGPHTVGDVSWGEATRFLREGC